MFEDLKREWDKSERKQRAKHGGRGFIAEAKHQREGVKALKEKRAKERAAFGKKKVIPSLGKKVSKENKKGLKKNI